MNYLKLYRSCNTLLPTVLRHRNALPFTRHQLFSSESASPSSAPSLAAVSSAAHSKSPIDELFGDVTTDPLSPAANYSSSAPLDFAALMQSVQTQIPILSSSQVHDNRVFLNEFVSKQNPPKLSLSHFQQLNSALEQINRKIAELKSLQLSPSPPSPPSDIPVDSDSPSGSAPLTQSSLPLAEQIHYFNNLSKTITYIMSRIHPVKPKVSEDEMNDLLDYMQAMPHTVNRLIRPEGQTPLDLMKMNMKTTRKNRHLYCQFCRAITQGKPEQLRYTNVNLLTDFVNERGMVLSRDVTRLCQYHQRQVSVHIKRARTIGLMSFKSNWKVPIDFVYGTEAITARGLSPDQIANGALKLGDGHKSVKGNKVDAAAAHYPDLPIDHTQEFDLDEFDFEKLN